MKSSEVEPIEIWRWLASDEAHPYLHATEKHPALLQHLALVERTAIEQQWQLQAKLVGRFGPGRFLGTARGVEQASDRVSARYKASLVPAEQLAIDGCCGIGSDLFALAERGPAIGIEIDPGSALCAGYNCRSRAAAVVCDDLLKHPIPSGAWLHLDPDRRPENRRVSDAERMQPPLSALRPLLAKSAGAIVKLAPGARVADRPAGLRRREWIGVGRHCRQQILLFHADVPEVSRMATLLDRSGTLLAQFALGPEGEGDEPDRSSKPLRYLYDPHATVRAAGLTLAWGARQRLATLGGGAGFLTGDQLFTGPLATTFEVLDFLPGNPKRLVKALKEKKLAPTAIKIRQIDWEPPEVTLKRCRGLEGEPCEILVGRTDQRKFVLAVRRVASPEPMSRR